MWLLDRLREKPQVFYRRDGEIAADLSRAFSVAHNAGDATDIADRALAYGADVVEIDVMTRGGRLAAGHPRHLWIFSRLFLWTIPLDEAWDTASRGKAVKLDLKGSSLEYQRLLFDFLRRDRQVVPVFAVTRHAALLKALEAHVPGVVRVLSVTEDGLRALKADVALAKLIDGVSGHPDRFDADTIAWLRERRIVSMTSVVNSMAQADDLLRRGVNGIITDNLAIIEAIARVTDRELAFEASSLVLNDIDEESDERSSNNFAR